MFVSLLYFCNGNCIKNVFYTSVELSFHRSLFVVLHSHISVYNTVINACVKHSVESVVTESRVAYKRSREYFFLQHKTAIVNRKWPTLLPDYRWVSHKNGFVFELGLFPYKMMGQEAIIYHLHTAHDSSPAFGLTAGEFESLKTRTSVGHMCCCVCAKC